MSMTYSVVTSSQVLLFGILVFILLAGLAFWFYRQADDSAEPESPPKVRPPEGKPARFIPVVVPTKTRPRPVRTDVSPPVVRTDVSAESSASVVVDQPKPKPVEVVPVSTPAAIIPRIADVHAEVGLAEDGTQVLTVRTRGEFPDALVGRMFFDVRFAFSGMETAQLRFCPRLGAGWLPLRFRNIHDKPSESNEWIEVGMVPLASLAAPISGNLHVQVICSAYPCESGADFSDANVDSDSYCAVASGVTVPFVGLGYDEVAAWLACREKLLSVIAGCACGSGLAQDEHRAKILEWIDAQCDSLDANPEFRRTSRSRLIAQLESTQLGAGCTSVACHDIIGTVGPRDEVLASLPPIFAFFGSRQVLSICELEQISQVCLWLGLACPQSVDSALAEALAVRPPVVDEPAPQAPSAPQTQTGPRKAGFPFTVSLSVVGSAASPEGFQVMVSGDLPVRASATDDLYFTVNVTDPDLRTSWPFLVQAKEVDGLVDPIVLSSTVTREQYDPTSPRKVAEVLFKDCAFPRNGERTLQVSCVGYSVDGKGGLTRLCSGDASSTLKVSGTGYVVLRKRRRSLRGLALELALAAGTGGAVTLAQKTIAKDWIVAQASTVADPDERKLTVNYLTKILLGASGMSQAEVVALALRLNGYRQVRYSQETVRLAELLAAAKPATKFKVLASLGKLRKELGLPAAPSAVKPTAPTVQPMKTVARAAPAKPVKPVTPKATPRTPPPQLNPRQLRARDLNRKLGRSVAGWKTMSVVRKIAHLKSEMMAKTNRMPACKGLADRHVLQEEITDLSELVVLLRAGKA
jgi:hypothetical protein